MAHRALEKLQTLLKQRGVTVPVAALGVALAAEAVTAAPTGLAASVAGSALAGAAAASGVTLSIFRIMAKTKLKFGLVGAVLVGGLATSLIVQHPGARVRQPPHKRLQPPSCSMRCVIGQSRHIGPSGSPAKEQRQGR